MEPLVSIIIVTLSARDFLEGCLRSIKESSYQNFEIVYVDNASKDGSLGLVQEKFPEVKIVRNRKNLGFAGGNNAGIEFAGGEIIFLLNDDTIIHPELIEILVKELASSPEIGIVGPKIYFMPEDVILNRSGMRSLADARDKIWFAGGQIDWARGQTSHMGKGLTDNELADDKKREVDFITGCALMIKRELIDKIGLLDRKFFAFYEDADWCQKAKKAGYRVVYVPFGGVWHIKSATASYIFLDDLKSQLKNAGLSRKIRVYLQMARRYFVTFNRLKFCNWRNHFVFFMRHAPLKYKIVNFFRFIFVETPKFLWTVIFQVPWSLVKISQRYFKTK